MAEEEASEQPALVTRRAALRAGAAAGAALVVGGLGAVRSVGAQPAQLSVSGAGVNVKEMPGPNGEAVPLRESFGFDAHYAQCIVEDNPEAFAMDTFGMGPVVIEPHEFFMAMHSNQLSLASISALPDGRRMARLTGALGCITYAGTATVSVGSRTEKEPAVFEIEAVDGGQGGGAAGDSFTFTGTLVEGEVTISAPVLRSLLGA